MNVLFVSLRGPAPEKRKGGAQEYIYQIARYLAIKGHKVRIICSNETVEGIQLPDEEEVGGVLVRRVCGPILRVPWILLEVRKAWAWSDIVIENVMGPPMLIPLASKLEGRPSIAIVHHLEGLHYFCDNGSKNYHGLLKRSVAFGLEQCLLPIAYRDVSIVANSKKTQRELCTIGFQSRYIEVVPPAIQIGDSSLTGNKAQDVLYVGSVHLGRKRVDHLISAFQLVNEKVKDARLIIAGDGPDLLICKEMAKGLAIEFRGFVSEVEKWELLRQASVFASPSDTEGFGITWIEANAAGLPVIAYDLGLDTLNSACAILVERGDIAGLAKAIVDVISDESLRESMASAARNNAARFSWAASGEKFLGVIERATSVALQQDLGAG